MMKPRPRWTPRVIEGGGRASAGSGAGDAIVALAEGLGMDEAELRDGAEKFLAERGVAGLGETTLPEDVVAAAMARLDGELEG